MRELPGPRGLEVMPWLRGMRNDVLQTLPALRHRYGDVARLPIPGRGEVVLVSHPDGVQQVLQSRHTDFPKARTYEVLGLLLGEGLLTSRGEHWRTHRRIAQPAFHRRSVDHFGQIMVEETLTQLDRWSGRREIQLARELRELTLRIVGRSLFSDDLSDESERVGAALDEVLSYAQERFRSPLGPFVTVPTPGLRRFRKAAEVLDEIVRGLIRRHRQSAPERDDLLSMLMAAEDEETGERLSDDELRDEIITFMLAGHETTAHALTWTLLLLGRHAHERRQLEAELESVLNSGAPSTDDLADLSYTEAVVNEGMRLYPPAWVLDRTPRGDQELDGYHIPEGALVMVSQWVTHRHPDAWDAPESFDPERFLDDRAGDRHRFAFFPFGGGPRMCIGFAFAEVEAQLVLATIAQQVRLDPLPGYPVDTDPAVTLRPKNDLRMLVTKR